MTTFRIARAALARNRVRTALTTLGITIGIAAVICTVALGQGSAAAVAQQVAALGDSFVWIQPGSARTGGARAGWGSTQTLTPADAAAILASVPRIKACSPQVSGREQIVADGENWNTRYTGIAPEYLAIRHWGLAAGGAFARADVAATAKVLVLGANVAQALFGDQSAVGRTVRMGRFPFLVIGVLQARGASGAGTNQDDQVLLPYTTALKKLSGKTWLDGLVCSTNSAEDIPRAEAAIAMVLRDQHRLGPDEPDDFNLRSPVEMMTLRAQTTQTLALMLTAIAAVSLLVGGIGIMNIMLVSVAERTREIGLRMALGARDGDITRQFLVEALLLGAVGGVSGVVCGVAGAQIMRFGFGWPTELSAGSIALATGCALAASFVFGYYPAIHASGLDPIEALRVEA
ncbi:MAG TPA: ABC transporter permease [Vicinamibacterales bacterium]|nr:ABC transporter permease [Vicinamibacterales bacterium]